MIFKPNNVIISIEPQQEDNEVWVQRHEIVDAETAAVYLIAQHRKKRHWACSCSDYQKKLRCKHLTSLKLPVGKIPYEIIFN